MFPDFSKQEDLHDELKIYLVEYPKIGMCLKHPLVFGVPYSSSSNAFYNHQYIAKKTAIEESKSKKNWNRYIAFHERPCRLSAFVSINHSEISDEDFWNILGFIITDSENLWQNKSALKNLLSSCRPKKENLMSEEERVFLKSLPDKVTVYRGYNPLFRNKSGLSWTLSYEIAHWFANRFNYEGNVAKGTILKKHIQAAFLGRSEMEIFVEPRKVKLDKDFELKSPGDDEDVKHVWEYLSTNRVYKSKYHGPLHWQKVYNNVLVLDESERIDLLVCKLFAIIHDSKRENDDDDPKHGHRAADWALDEYNKGKLKISQSQMSKLDYACRYHNDGKISNDLTIGACWDSDRLDLPRVSIAPDKKYFSTETGKRLIFNI